MFKRIVGLPISANTSSKKAVRLFMETVVKTISNHVKKLPKCIAYRTNRECEYFVKKGQAESNRMRGLT